ncbi:MAG: protein kinase [Planctomycetota bacterium]
MQRIDRYELLGEIARGGMGVVYRARDPLLGREVALKLLLELGDPEERERFVREAQIAAQARHPGLVPVLNAGAVGARPWLVMELVAGESLQRRLEREGPLPEAEAARLVAEVARALAAAHALGVVHRDLKPANVLLEHAPSAPLEGQPRLTDFGVARLRDSALTQTGEVIGTPGYMAPEQARGERAIDARTDVYGLGATLYALLSGRPPHQGASALAVLAQVTAGPPRSPSAWRPGLDRALEAICLRCLAQEPADRYPDALTVAAALEGWLRGDRDDAPPRRRPLVAVAVVVALAGLGAARWLRSGDTPSPSPSLANPAPTSALGWEQREAEAKAHLQRWEPAAVIASLEPALERGDLTRAQRAAAFGLLGRAYGMQRRWAASEDAFAGAVPPEGPGLELLLARGRTRLERAHLTRNPWAASARSDLTRAAELAEGKPGALALALGLLAQPHLAQQDEGRGPTERALALGVSAPWARLAAAQLAGKVSDAGLATLLAELAASPRDPYLQGTAAMTLSGIPAPRQREAQRLLEAALQVHPKHPLLIAQQGWIAGLRARELGAETGAPEAQPLLREAERCLSAALALEQDFGDARYERAQILLLLGDEAAARQDLELVVGLDRGHVDAREQLERLRAGPAAGTGARSGAGSSAWAWVSEALTCIERWDPAAALRAIERTPRRGLEPEALAALRELEGRALGMQRRWDEAEDAFTAAAGGAAPGLRLLLLRGRTRLERAYFDRPRAGLARADLEAAAKLAASVDRRPHSEALALLAQPHLTDRKNALLFARRALELRGTPWARLVVLELGGSSPEQLAALREELRGASRDPYLMATAGMVLGATGQVEEGAGLVQAALALHPDHPFVLAQRGYLWSLRGQEQKEQDPKLEGEARAALERALGCLDRALSYEGRFGDACYQRAWVLGLLDRPAEARRDLLRALELDPDDRRSRDGLRRLDALHPPR